jgi:hypothetical protein
MKKTRKQLRDERDEIIDQMTAALAKPDMKKFDRLNTKYQKLSDKIRGKK